jgi:hypothetical protein
MLTILNVSVSIAIVKSRFTTASVTVKRPFTVSFTIVIVIAVEITGETSRVRVLVLRRMLKAMGGWIREVWVDSWRTVVANGFSSGSVAEEPGDVGLLHGVYGGRGGRASQVVISNIYSCTAQLMAPHRDVIPWNVIYPLIDVQLYLSAPFTSITPI